MDDPRPEAPELNLTSVADEDGDDALQVTLSDSVAGLQFSDAFTIDSAAPQTPASLEAPPPTPPPAKAPAAPAKPHRPNVQLGDDRFVAALLGRPMESPKKNRKSKTPTTAPAATEKPKPLAAKLEPVEPLAPEKIAVAEPASSEVIPEQTIEVAFASTITAKSGVVAPAPIATPAVTDLISARIHVPPPTPAAPVIAPPAARPATEVVVERPKVIRPTPRPVGPVAATAPVTVIAPETPIQLLPIENISTPSTIESKPAEVAAKIIPMLTPTPANTPMPAAPAAVPPSQIVVEKSLLDLPSEPPPPMVDQAAFARDFALPKPARPAAAIPAPAKTQSAKPVRPQPAIVSTKALRPINVAPAAAESLPRAATGAWWTLPLMFVGLLMIACALIVPVADENHRAAYELAKIERDVAHFQSQSDTNESFLRRVSSDPALAERLAMRQLNMIRPDEKFAALKSRHDAFSMSPFALVSVDPPAPMPAYRPIGGFLSRWFLSPRFQIYFVGVGLLLTAAGVVFGGGGKADTRQAIDARQVIEPA